jgi:hypothetical protein
LNPLILGQLALTNRRASVQMDEDNVDANVAAESYNKMDKEALWSILIPNECRKITDVLTRRVGKL